MVAGDSLWERESEDMITSRCILLDLGQVLVRINFRNFGDRMQALTGMTAEQLRDAITGDGLPHRYEVGGLEDAQFHREVCRRVRHNIPWDVFVDAWNSIFIPTPLLPEGMLESLAQHHPLWVISNTNRIHFDFIRSHYQSVLCHFTGFVLSHEVGLAKPDPAIYSLALERAGVKTGEALFVDDQAANVEAARNLGMDAFQFLTPDQFAGELRTRHLL